ncbi:MAG: NPCBM/NEW2 domain-containing protein [Verrucomicrobiota bacterium]
MKFFVIRFGRRKHLVRAATVLFLTVGVCLAQNLARAVSVTPDELEESRAWASARFEGVVLARTNETEIVVVANHDVVQKNSRHDKPLRLGDKNFSRGLYCHAPSKLVVRLPGAGKKLTAIVGVDSNEQTSGGRGSVDFSVTVAGAEKFRSGVMSEKSAGKPVEVALNGATEFILQVEETPDGIACDQADWADAKVTLNDGREIWLGDLPLRQGERPAYSTAPPFSFVYDGKTSKDLLKEWKLERSSRRLDENRTERLLKWTDAKTGLQVRCVAVEYADFPTVEWTVYFKNTGTNDTLILSAVLALDLQIVKTGGGDFVLHHNKGTFVRADDFEPLTTTIKAETKLRFAPPGGRPLGQVFPYFNLEQAGDEGVIAVVGWPGQWFAEFSGDSSNGVRLIAGQEKTHFRLKDGEEVRTPLAVLQFWRGDWVRAQNIWRRWMFAHNVPRQNGKPFAPQMMGCSSHQFGEMIRANEENQKLFVDRYLEEKLPLDYWWMDAGWYDVSSKLFPPDWPTTGNWKVDTNRFPHGLRAITDHGHAKGVKSIVWFEPERVAQGTWLYTNNPAWLLGPDGNQKLLNLGHPDALKWAIEHFSKIIRDEGIDLYRQDYNVDPLAYWRDTDAPERQGITENHYVSGYLAYWDALLHEFPNLIIDSCASGGHRNDLETLRRSVPLLRSDYILEPVGQQGHTYGLAQWIPYNGTGLTGLDAYTFRSQMSSTLIACYDVRRKDLPYDEIRRWLTQWKKDVAPNYSGDFYPLTPYSVANDTWLAWQFDLPENSKGVVQAFRRTASIYESARLKLRGLEADARYAVVNIDDPKSEQIIAGRQLMEKGLLITAATQPAAPIYIYHKTK